MRRLKLILALLFPILGFSLREAWETFRESFIGKYFITWLCGFLIISFIILVLFTIFSFILWEIPTFNHNINEIDLCFIRGAFILYSWVILALVTDHI